MVPNQADQTNSHLQQALYHLKEAQDGDLRRTNHTAIQAVIDTIADILHERKHGE